MKFGSVTNKVEKWLERKMTSDEFTILSIVGNVGHEYYLNNEEYAIRKFKSMLSEKRQIAIEKLQEKMDELKGDTTPELVKGDDEL